MPLHIRAILELLKPSLWKPSERQAQQPKTKSVKNTPFEVGD